MGLRRAGDTCRCSGDHGVQAAASGVLTLLFGRNDRVTNREQGSETRAYARGHLRQLGFPLPFEERLIVFRDTSDKSAAREAIAARYKVPFLVGDNLNDYKRDYYVADVAERLSVMERDRDDYGQQFIVLPNPTDGHWGRAIFGESEPAPTDEKTGAGCEMRQWVS